MAKELELSCLNCGGKELRSSGTRWRGQDGHKVLKKQYECKGCGKVSVNIGIKQLDGTILKGRINAKEE